MIDPALWPSPEDMVGMGRLVAQDVARRYHINPEIVWLEAQVIFWPDTSLGFPSPGVEYEEVDTKGLIIEAGIEKNGQIIKLRYHTDLDDDIKLVATMRVT